MVPDWLHLNHHTVIARKNQSVIIKTEHSSWFLRCKWRIQMLCSHVGLHWLPTDLHSGCMPCFEWKRNAWDPLFSFLISGTSNHEVITRKFFLQNFSPCFGGFIVGAYFGSAVRMSWMLKVQPYILTSFFLPFISSQACPYYNLECQDSDLWWYW